MMASQGGPHPTGVLLGRTDREDQLRRAIRRLERNCHDYDEGASDAVETIAVTVSSLVDDRQGRRGRDDRPALLRQLDLQNRKFFDISYPREPWNEASHASLVWLADGKWHALLDNWPEVRAVDFSTWWQAECLHVAGLGTYSRQTLIQTMRDKEAAHFDERVAEAYYKATRDMGVFTTDLDGNILEVRPQGPAHATVRHIGHELLKALVPNYGRRANFPDGMTVVTMPQIKLRRE